MLASLNNEKLKQTFIENMLNKDFVIDEAKWTSTSVKEDEKSVIEEDDETRGKYSANENEYIHIFENELNYDLSTLIESNSSEEYNIERKFRETRLYQIAPVSTNMILAYISHKILGMPRSY